MILREIRRMFVALIGLMAWAMFCALVTGCATEPATIITHGGTTLECPGVIREAPDAPFLWCGDVMLHRDWIKSVNHFGPRSWWY